MQRCLVNKPLESEKIEVPLAIQTYLWRQTSFFLKPNLNEKKAYGPVCTAFEKIICENRVCDLPPNLSSSMNTIPRWHFVEGALPFVLHCCSALLSNRAQHGIVDQLTVAETKLLYTLHWILLKAPEEVDNYAEKRLPLSTVELFVQAVVPFVNCIQAQDLTSRLQDGLELWKALWDYRAPPLKSFMSSVVLNDEKSEGDKTSFAHSSRSSFRPVEGRPPTFFHLAVLKCLMLPDWHDEGRAWSLQYIMKYLEDEVEAQSKERASLAASPNNDQSKNSNGNSAELTADGEAEVSLAGEGSKIGASGTSAPNIDKLKRFYGFSSREESSSGKERLSVKRVRNVSTSSTSSLFDALSAMANIKLDDIQINVEVTNGAKEFLDDSGFLKKSVFLDVICHIARQSSNARVCSLVLSVLEHIFDKYIIQTRCSATYKDSPESIPSDKEHTETGATGNAVDEHGAKPLGEKSSTEKISFHSSFQKALICVIKVICALGCSYGCGKGIRGVTGKNLRAKAISMLTKLRAAGEGAFKTGLKSYFEEEDVEVVTNFLHALLGFCTMTLESKATQKSMGDMFKEKSGVVGVVIDCVFSSYISKLMEFNLQEISNVTLYGHVRQLVKYVKEYAGGTFFRVVFSGLLKVTGEPVKRLQEMAPGQKSTLYTTDGETASHTRTSGSEKAVTPKMSRKLFFPKFSRSGSSADGSPTGSNEFGFEGNVTPMMRKKGIKRHIKKGSAAEESFAAEEEYQSGNSLDRRRKSIMKKFFKTGRKKADEIFTTDSKKAEGASSTSTRQQNSSVEYISIPVKVKEIRDGMMVLSMLLESSLPGSVPDPNIVAGILELKAPAVARGALLLECAHFVQRCNKGDWPSWLLSSHPSSRRGKGFGALVRNAIAVSRRNVRIKHEAGLMFYKWAVAIGERLEQIESRNQSTLENKEVIYSIKHPEENFLDEGTLDEETRKCPYALKMVACQLLLEITAFLRESHSSLAAKAEIQRQRNRSVAFSRTPRRVTQKIPAYVGIPEHRDAVTSGPAERLRHVSQTMLAPIMTLSVPQVQLQEGDNTDQRVPAPVIKVDDGPRDGNGETEKSAQNKKRFSNLFSNPEKKRKYTKPANSERKASITMSRLSKKLPTRAHKVASRVTSDASDNSDIEEDEVTKFPWLKAVALVSGSTNLLCEHRDLCQPSCIRRQTQSCSKFMSALKTVYATPVSQVTQKTSKKSEADKGRQCKLSTKELTIKEKEKRDKIMITYIGEKVRNLFNCPMSVIIKGAVVMEPSLMLDIIPLAWELLLSPLEELVSTAAAVFLIASLHLRAVVEKMLHKELTCDNCEHQVKSLIRYGVLWRSRYHVWPRMEAGAKFVLKIPLPKLDFTLPSPPVGSCAPTVPDCPWDPKASMDITKNELELTEEDREKDKEEASKIKEEKKKQRSEYTFTNISVSLEASVPVEPEGNDIITQPVTTDFWPPAMCSAVPCIIGILDDSSITMSQTAVSEMAMRILWDCLVDDPTLFFRTFFEDITKANKQKELVFLLNKMLIHIPTLPPNAGTILFNHLVGVVLYYSRRSQPCSEDAIALILSALMWKIVPSVPNLYLKDLKYSAKKEHCERTLMVTANTPGTKKIVIVCHALTNGENEKVTVLEDMSFEHVLQFCTSKWCLDNPLYCFLDAKSGLILEGKHLVRDVYAFKKGFPYPQLMLQLYDEHKGYLKRQEQAFTSKLSEVGRLYLTHGILEAVQNWHHVSFLHSELSKQMAFPRKALDVDFALYEGGIKGMQLCAMDAIHKRMWVKLLSKLFDSMTSSFPWGDNDLHLFLNVINGALLLQCEDSSMLRLCFSTLINAAIKFSDIFAIDGYHHILPTLVLLHSHHENNDIVSNAVEFVISQFYCLHQKPFLLQLFASIEPLLLTENVNKMPEHSDDIDETTKILPKCLFNILSSLEKDIPDSLDILALVDADKPLIPLDSCYEGKLDSENESKIDIAIRLCVTVVAYSPESIRATQMLVVLSSILPFYLEYVKKYNEINEKKKESRDELTALSSLRCSVQVLLKSCNSLRRPFLKNKGFNATKKRIREGSVTGSITSFTTSHENIRQCKNFVVDDEDRDVDSIDQQFKPFLNKFSTQDEGEQVLDSLYEFRTPRNAILIIVSEFISTSKKRLCEISQTNSSHNFDLSLDSESIQVLCNIAHTLLKLALTDTVSLESTGVQKFMLEALPNIDWSVEDVIPGINLILKRINTTFIKIVDKPDLMNFFWPYPLLLHRSENWNVTEVLLKGLYLTFSRHTAVVALPYTKAVIATCMRLILRESVNDSEADNPFIYFPPPSLSFCQLVVKLAATLMFSLKDKYCLKDLCGGTIEFGSADRTLRVLVHILLPLCMRLGTGSKDQPKASKADVAYAVSCLLNIIVTPLVDVSSSARRLSSAISSNDLDNLASPDFVQRVLPRKSDTARFSPSIYKAAYLGLKILIICFPDFLSTEWRTIAAVLKEVVLAGTGNDALWEFLDFTVLHRTPLFLLLLPIIRTKLSILKFTSARGKILKETLLKQLSNPPHPTPSKRTWMKRFIQELGLLTGSNQNDMFLYRNPNEPGGAGSSTGLPDLQSLLDAKTDCNLSEIIHEVPKKTELKRTLSSISQGSSDKTHREGHTKNIKKRVSFDKGMSSDVTDMILEADRSIAEIQKRQLHRQELAVDIQSPISSKKLSQDYPTTSFDFNKASTGEIDHTADSILAETNGENKERKRREKNRKIIPEVSNCEDALSMETANKQNIFKEGNEHTPLIPSVYETKEANIMSETSVSKTNNDIVSNLAETAVTTVSMKLNVEEKCDDESDSLETSDQTVLLPPSDQSRDATADQRNIEEIGDAVAWSHTKLDNSKETCL